MSAKEMNMSFHATSAFVIDTWEEEPYDEQDGVKLTRTRVTKTFRGEIEGQSTAELLMTYAQSGSAAYVGFERIAGRLHSHSGSFILQHSASSARSVQAASWTIVPDSGTGELAGIHGEGHITIESNGGHTFTLDYDLNPAS
jgi:hypothetical protein